MNQQGEQTSWAWSVVRVHILDAAKMGRALSFGWEPFATTPDFVLLRRHAWRKFGNPEPDVQTGEWNERMEWMHA